jgi:spore coat protein CotH
MYVECTVNFEGLEWEHVGIRYKGNASLQYTYDEGRKKYPFRLDFDEFEDVYPETRNQRFWGVKWMVFNNNHQDPSMLREKLTYDLFRQLGGKAGRAAHYRLFINHGEGKTYYGLYTSAEVVDKRFLEARFDDAGGNLYKPDGVGADLTEFVQETFEKKTNEGDADWSDVINLIDVLNASYGSPAQFKTAIDGVFHVDSFLNWLVVNSVLCNIDSYAGTFQNYYLYNDPDTGLFYFIPWDCNLSFGNYYDTYNADTITEWDILNPVDMGPKPLIERILWVPEYMDTYKLRVRSFCDNQLKDSIIHPRMDYLHNLALPFVVGPDGEFEPYTLLGHQNEFVTNLESDVPPTGIWRVLGLKSFLADRKAYIDSVIP